MEGRFLSSPYAAHPQTPWSQSPASLRKACPSLSADYAVVPLPFDRSDLRYAAMQWPIECAKVGICDVDILY